MNIRLEIRRVSSCSRDRAACVVRSWVLAWLAVRFSRLSFIAPLSVVAFILVTSPQISFLVERIIVATIAITFRNIDISKRLETLFVMNSDFVDKSEREEELREVFDDTLSRFFSFLLHLAARYSIPFVVLSFEGQREREDETFQFLRSLARSKIAFTMTHPAMAAFAAPTRFLRAIFRVFISTKWDSMGNNEPRRGAFPSYELSEIRRRARALSFPLPRPILSTTPLS